MKIDAETLKKQVILHLPYVLFLLVFAKLGEAVRLAPGADASQKLLGLSEGFALAFQSMWPGAAMDWLIGLCGAAIMRLAVYLRAVSYTHLDVYKRQARIDAFSTEYHEMGRHLKNMGRAIQGKPAETDAKENGKVARVFKGAFKVEGALISSINRNAEWALNTLARLEQTAERRPSVLEAMREQAAKTEPAKKQPAPSHDKESR